ncbi:hypothetical protein BDR03DRAFT_987855 [Suillus americanus]|nr:hypothetical protein BDR03DRAFT_987855 [Suillus americanus]
MFLQDATGSQQQYIGTARHGIAQFCNTLLSGGKFVLQDLRLGLIAFRDHPPQEHNFIIQEYPFTSNFASNLTSLTAADGGDQPDSQSPLPTKLTGGTRRQSRNRSVTDAKLEIDSLRVAASMGRVGITLNLVSTQYVIVYEPTLSYDYKRARDFYQGLVQKTGVRVVNLCDRSVLPTLTADSTLEAVDGKIGVAKHQAEVCSMANKQKTSASKISVRPHRNFVAASIQHSTSLSIICTNRGDRNANIWFDGENLHEAKNNILEVEGSHILNKYQTPGVGELAAIETQPISLAQVMYVHLSWEGTSQKNKILPSPPELVLPDILILISHLGISYPRPIETFIASEFDATLL